MIVARQRHIRWLLLLRTTGLLLLLLRLRLLLQRSLMPSPPPPTPPTTSNWRLKSVRRNPANTNSDCANPAIPASMTVPTSTVTSTMPKWRSRVTRVIPTSPAAILNWNWNWNLMIWWWWWWWWKKNKKQDDDGVVVLCFFYCPVCVCVSPGYR